MSTADSSCRRYRWNAIQAFVVAVALTGHSTTASGQVVDDFRSEARMRAGPFYLTPALTLENLGIDTNVFNTAGERQEDFMFALKPRVESWIPFARRALLQAAVTGGVDYYHHFASERSFNPDIMARLEIPLYRLTLYGGGQYLNTRDRPSFEIDVRSRRVVDDFDAGIEVNVLRKLSLELSGRRFRSRYDRDAVFLGTSLQETLNREERSASLAAKWRTTPLTAVVLTAAARTSRFEFSPDRNANSASATIGAQFHPRALVSGNGYLGVRRFDPRSTSLPDYTGLVASASLSYRLLGSTVLSYTAERDVGYSFEPLEPYYVLTGQGLEVTRQIVGPFDVKVGVERYDYAYRRLISAPSLSSVGRDHERVDVIWNLRGSVGYRVNRETRIGVGVSYFDRDSGGDATRQYNGLRAGLTLNYGS